MSQCPLSVLLCAAFAVRHDPHAPAGPPRVGGKRQWAGRERARPVFRFQSI